MKKSNTDFLAGLCYTALVLAAILIFFCNLMPKLGINLENNFWDRLFSVLAFIKEITIVFALSLGSFTVAKKGKAWLIIYIIAVALYIGAAILGLF